jgi:toxin FitB
MYVLDTNVLSEFRKRHRMYPKVAAWAASVPVDETFLSAITILEIEIGTLQMERKDARQGKSLRLWLEDSILIDYRDRILPVDVNAARECASLHVPNRQPERDALIAATALVHGMTVVTRNVADFAPTGVRIFNPWA